MSTPSTVADRPPTAPVTTTHTSISSEAYLEMHRSAEFQTLRRRFRRFVFPMTAAFLIWYFSFVLLAAYATEFFSIRVTGYINIGMLFGFGQFLSTAVITLLYVRWAERNIDGLATRLRYQLELDAE